MFGGISSFPWSGGFPSWLTWSADASMTCKNHHNKASPKAWNCPSFTEVFYQLLFNMGKTSSMAGNYSSIFKIPLFWQSSKHNLVRAVGQRGHLRFVEVRPSSDPEVGSGRMDTSMPRSSSSLHFPQATDPRRCGLGGTLKIISFQPPGT